MDILNIQGNIAKAVDSAPMNFLKGLWKNFIDKGLPGGICDMTPISHFYNLQSGKIADLAKLEGGIFDCGINVSSNYVDNEFVMDCGMKKIEFKIFLVKFQRRMFHSFNN